MTGKKKKLLLIYITIVSFAFLVGTGLFYLSLVYDLPFLSNIGYNQFNSQAKLLNVSFKNAYIENKSVNDFINVSSTGKHLSFNVSFSEENIKIIKFRIKNVGDKTTVLGDLVTGDSDHGNEITIIWPTISQLVLKPGERSNEYSIVIIREKDETQERFDDIRAELTYTEYIK